MERQKNNLQDNPEWYRDRLFHFTSSELYKLLSEPREKVKKKAGEVAWGKELEISARHAYEKKKGVEVNDCGFFEFNDYFGGSPDGLVGQDGFIEIKCPFNTSIHVKHLRLKDENDLKKEHYEYYVQIQGNFIATGRKWCDFISYDPRCQSELFALKVIRVLPDQEFIENCIKKLAKANEYKEKVMDEIIKLQCA